MKIRAAVVVAVAIVLLSAFSYAQDGAPFQPQRSGWGNDFGPGANFEGEFSSGLQPRSAADQDYVARSNLAAAMTGAYEWIGDNAASFIAGCKGDRPALVSKLAGVIKQSGEVSTVCASLTSEAEACTPNAYCPAFETGKLPFPPEVKSQFEKAGINLATLSLDQIDSAMLEKACAAQLTSEMETQKEKRELIKQKIKEKLAGFRQQCEAFEKRREEQESQAFDFQFPEFPDFDQPMDQGHPDGRQGGYRDECSSPPPRCPGDARSSCRTGRWVCEPPMQPQQPWQEPQPRMEPVPRQEPYEPQPLEEGSEPPRETEPETEPAPEPAPEPSAPASEEPAPVPAEAAAQRVLSSIFPITGFVTAFEEAPQAPASPMPLREPVPPQGMAGAPQPYPRDFGGEPGRPPYPYPYDQGRPPSGSGQGGYGYGEPGSSYDQPPQGQPGNRPMGPGYGPGGSYGGGGGGQGGFGSQGSGPSAERMCEMSDDEIVDMMAPQPPMDQMERQGGRCKEMAGRMAQDMANVKMRLAQCKAEAALMCAAKKEAAADCQSSVEEPEKFALEIVSQMCRKFGVINAEKVATPGFQGLITKFSDRDPALANQLGATVEDTQADQQRLGILSKLFGDGDYAQRIRERAEKLAAIRARLAATGSDPETLAALDEQVNQLNEEAGQFTNLFNMARLGKLFG